MTVGELADRMSMLELVQWGEYFRLRNEAQEKRHKGNTSIGSKRRKG